MFRKVFLTGIIGVWALIGANVPAIAAPAKEAAVPPPVTQAAAPAESTPKTDSIYEYSSMNRRDPFAPLIMKRSSGRERGISPLESYEIGEMKLIAILWEKNKYYAVVSLPDGKSYSVLTGARIGTHNGAISRITKDTVVITERIRDARGVLSPKNIVLKLRGEEE